MYAGTIGDFGTYSFNGNKIITTGGGGAVTAKDPEAVDHMRYLSTQALFGLRLRLFLLTLLLYL